MSLNYSLDGLVKLTWCEIKNHFQGIESIKINKDGSIHILANEYSDELQARDDSHIHLGAGVDVCVEWHNVDNKEYGARSHITNNFICNQVVSLTNVEGLPSFIWDTIITGFQEQTLLYNPEIKGMVVDAGARGTFIISMLPEDNTVVNLYKQADVLIGLKKIYIKNALAKYSRDLQKAEFSDRSYDETNTLWENFHLPQHNLRFTLPVTCGEFYKVTDGNGDIFTFKTIEDLMWWLVKNVYNT
jgi:hypothetical protein